MSLYQSSLASVIDRRPLGVFRIRIFVVCFLIILMDGFDTLAIGVAAKAMSASLDIPISQFGAVFSAGLFGAMLGALAFGPLSDSFGRRWLLVGSIVAFSLFSLATPHAPSFSVLLFFRFLAGLGLGGAIPNLLSWASEYAPRPIRGLLTGLLYTSFPLGGAMGAFAATQLFPLFGWPAIFYLGGTIPLVLAAMVAMMLPEPLRFLLLRPDGQQAVHRIVRQFAPDMPVDGPTYVDTEVHAPGLPIGHLFSRGRVASTLLLWISFFICFLLLIVLTLWVSALMREIGIDEKNATLIVGMITLGSVVGTGMGGRLVDLFNPFVALPLLFIVGAASLVLLGYSANSVISLSLFAALFGCAFGAASSGLLGVAILIYPSAIRATGVGWAMALGRMGQVIGPLVVGALLKAGFAPREILLLCAAPAVLAAVTSAALGGCLAGAFRRIDSPFLPK